MSPQRVIPSRITPNFSQRCAFRLVPQGDRVEVWLSEYGASEAPEWSYLVGSRESEAAAEEFARWYEGERLFADRYGADSEEED